MGWQREPGAPPRPAAQCRLCPQGPTAASVSGRRQAAPTVPLEASFLLRKDRPSAIRASPCIILSSSGWPLGTRMRAEYDDIPASELQEGRMKAALVPSIHCLPHSEACTPAPTEPPSQAPTSLHENALSSLSLPVPGPPSLFLDSSKVKIRALSHSFF